MTRSLLGVVVLVFAVGFGVTASGQTVLLEDDFDSENGGVGVTNYTGFANFSVTDGAVDLIGNGLADFFPGNGLYVDLDGTANDGGTLESAALTLRVGFTYTVQFDLGNPDDRFGGSSFDNEMTVTLGSALIETFSLDVLTPFATITRQVSVTADESAPLVFTQAGGDNLGMLIDNVSVVEVPEPRALVLMTLGIAAVLRRRGR